MPAGFRVTGRRVLLALALVLAAGFVDLLLQWFAVLPVSTNSEVVGAFRVRYRTYDSNGHRWTRISLYRRRWFLDEAVAKDVFDLRRDPNEPTRLFYEASLDSNGPCITYFYDATTDRKTRVGGCSLLDSAAGAEAWSSDHRFAALASMSNEAVIVELSAGKVVDVAALLEAQAPRQRVKFGPWMPDGKTHLIGVVVLATTQTDRSAPYVNIDQDLFVMYPERRRLEYIASGTMGFDEEDYRWQRLDTAWILPMRLNSVVASKDGVRRKTDAELPRAAVW